MRPTEPIRRARTSRRTYLELVSSGIVVLTLGSSNAAREEADRRRRGFGRVGYGDASFGSPEERPADRDSTES